MNNQNFSDISIFNKIGGFLLTPTKMCAIMNVYSCIARNTSYKKEVFLYGREATKNKSTTTIPTNKRKPRRLSVLWTLVRSKDQIIQTFPVGDLSLRPFLFRLLAPICYLYKA